jgi:hypothetical protein
MNERLNRWLSRKVASAFHQSNREMEQALKPDRAGVKLNISRTSSTFDVMSSTSSQTVLSTDQFPFFNSKLFNYLNRKRDTGSSVVTTKVNESDEDSISSDIENEDTVTNGRRSEISTDICNSCVQTTITSNTHRSITAAKSQSKGKQNHSADDDGSTKSQKMKEKAYEMGNMKYAARFAVMSRY